VPGDLSRRPCTYGLHLARIRCHGPGTVAGGGSGLVVRGTIDDRPDDLEFRYDNRWTSGSPPELCVRGESAALNQAFSEG
jgi:hypothetical protein